jgi:hypothetical protein
MFVLKNINNMELRELIKNSIKEYLNEASLNNKIINLINNFTKNDESYQYYINNNTISIKIIYIRFGKPRTDDSNKIVASKRHVYGQEVNSEDGVSVFEMGWDGKNIIYLDGGSALNSSFDELTQQGREVYWIDGEIDWRAEGADGEPIMIPETVKILAEIPKNLIIKY